MDALWSSIREPRKDETIILFEVISPNPAFPDYFLLIVGQRVMLLAESDNIEQDVLSSYSVTLGAAAA